jgi:hypothetical protein
MEPLSEQDDDRVGIKTGVQARSLSSYYPQENGQVEVVNKYLKSILKKTVRKSKSNWHVMLYLALWAY